MLIVFGALPRSALHCINSLFGRGLPCRPRLAVHLLPSLSLYSHGSAGGVFYRTPCGCSSFLLWISLDVLFLVIVLALDRYVSCFSFCRYVFLVFCFITGYSCVCTRCCCHRLVANRSPLTLFDPPALWSMKDTFFFRLPCICMIERRLHKGKYNDQSKSKTQPHLRKETRPFRTPIFHGVFVLKTGLFR